MANTTDRVNDAPSKQSEQSIKQSSDLNLVAQSNGSSGDWSAKSSAEVNVKDVTLTANEFNDNPLKEFKSTSDSTNTTAKGGASGDVAKDVISNYQSHGLPTFEMSMQNMAQDLKYLSEDLAGMKAGNAMAFDAFNMDRQLAALDARAMHMAMQNEAQHSNDSSDPHHQGSGCGNHQRESNDEKPSASESHDKHGSYSGGSDDSGKGTSDSSSKNSGKDSASGSGGTEKSGDGNSASGERPNAGSTSDAGTTGGAIDKPGSGNSDSGKEPSNSGDKSGSGIGQSNPDDKTGSGTTQSKPGDKNESGKDQSNPGDKTGSGTTPGGVVHPADGMFTAIGSQIIGPDGKPFVPVGINDTSPTTHNEYMNRMDELVSKGANTIRLMGNRFDISDPNSDFNKEVRAATDAGMVALVAYTPEANQYGGTGEIVSGQELQYAQDAMAASAEMYKDNPNVWFNTINESGANGDAQNPAWMQEQEAIMSSIRATGNKNPIVIDDTLYGQGATDPSLTQSGILANAKQLQSYGNVIASVHVYQSGDINQLKGNIQKGAKAIQDTGMPVMFGEYGLNGEDNSGLIATMQATEEMNIGRLVWQDGNQNGQYYADILQTANGQAVLDDWAQARAANS